AGDLLTRLVQQLGIGRKVRVGASGSVHVVPGLDAGLLHRRRDGGLAVRGNVAVQVRVAAVDLV
ncbi:MAG: hypothetical protein AVDCRST_MAG89-2056, partial [uncultured Gemmatimonadetes bacterium]